MEMDLEHLTLQRHNMDKYYNNMPYGFCIIHLPSESAEIFGWQVIYANAIVYRELHAGSLEELSKFCMKILASFESSEIQSYREAAYQGKCIEGDKYISELSRYYDISAYQLEYGYIGVLFKDVTEKVMYNNVLTGAVAAYRQIYYIHFRDDRCYMVYPDYSGFTEAQKYSDVIGTCFKKERIYWEDVDKTREFLSRDNIEAALKTQDMVEFQFRCRDENNNLEWCQVSFAVHQRTQEKLVSAIMTIRSIDSFLKRELEQQILIEQALAQAESASRAKSEFLSNMSHDIRTPLNAIIGFTSIAQNNMDQRQTLNECLARIKISGKHLLRLINDILDMSRIESGKVNIEETKTDFEDFMEDFKNIIQAQVDMKRQNLLIDISDITHRNVYMDRLHMSQILINIVGNAVKYTGEGGNISVTVSENAESDKNYSHYIFKIKDNGIGIKKEFLPQIFGTFTRENAAGIAEVEGSGLGLSISKSIVELMGGHIEVDSTEKVGTEFTVVIPLKVCADSIASSAVQKHQDGSASSRTVRGIKILVVDDNEFNRELAVEILKEKGAVVSCAKNGQEALDMIVLADSDAFDIILMDVRMPVMNGYEAALKIRALSDKAKADIPIIAMTAHAFEQDRREALKNGMNGHIAKPIDMDQIEEMIMAFL